MNKSATAAPETYLTAEEAAKALGCSPGWVTTKCKRGDVGGATKRGRTWQIPRSFVVTGMALRKALDDTTTETKACLDCGGIFPNNTNHFHAVPSGAPGPLCYNDHRARLFAGKQRKQKRKRKKMPTTSKRLPAYDNDGNRLPIPAHNEDDPKYCYGCDKTKTFRDFWHDRNRYDFHQSKCKVCQNAIKDLRRAEQLAEQEYEMSTASAPVAPSVWVPTPTPTPVASDASPAPTPMPTPVPRKAPTSRMPVPATETRPGDDFRDLTDIARRRGSEWIKKMLPVIEALNGGDSSFDSILGVIADALGK